MFALIARPELIAEMSPAVDAVVIPGPEFNAYNQTAKTYWRKRGDVSVKIKAEGRFVIMNESRRGKSKVSDAELVSLAAGVLPEGWLPVVSY